MPPRWGFVSFFARYYRHAAPDGAGAAQEPRVKSRSNPLPESRAAVLGGDDFGGQWAVLAAQDAITQNEERNILPFAETKAAVLFLRHPRTNRQARWQFQFNPEHDTQKKCVADDGSIRKL